MFKQCKYILILFVTLLIISITPTSAAQHTMELSSLTYIQYTVSP